MRQATSVAHFEWRHNDRYWPIKDHCFIHVTFVTRAKTFTEHFIRVWFHTSKISKVSRNISYVYEFIRRRFHARIKSNAFEKIRVCKIPWMILHNDTRIKSYTYEKLHVWKVTRIEYWALIGALLYAYRFFHGTFVWKAIHTKLENHTR